MSFQANYEMLEDFEQLDLAVVANNTVLRKLIAQELSAINDRLMNMQIPVTLTLESSVEFCLRYKDLQEQRQWLEQMATTLQTAAALLQPQPQE